LKRRKAISQRDLPEDLFVKQKPAQSSKEPRLKHLMTQFILSGLAVHEPGSKLVARRMPPPVAIRRIPGQSPRPALSNRELYAILDAEDIHATRAASSADSNKV
jgi:hypothetical protein